MEQMKERESQFELLRIVAMLMIIGAHLSRHGIMHITNENLSYQVYGYANSTRKLFACLLSPGGEVGVSLFFMLTGYFLIDKKKRGSILKIVLETLFYGILSVAIFACSYFAFGEIYGLSLGKTLPYLVKLLLIPSSSGAWWFVSAYILLVVISPIINEYVKRFNLKGYFILLLAIWMFWYAISFATDGSYYSLQRAVFFYLIGGFIKRTDNSKRKKIILLFAFISCLSWLCCTGIYYLIGEYACISNLSMRNQMIVKSLETVKTAILIPIIAVSIFSFFDNLKLKYCKVINNLASLTFGVYLLHDSLITRNVLWNNLLKIDAHYISDSLFVFYSLGIILAIYVICSLIDFCRKKLLEPMALKITQTVADKIVNKYSVNMEK